MLLMAALSCQNQQLHSVFLGSSLPNIGEAEIADSTYSKEEEDLLVLACYASIFKRAQHLQYNFLNPKNYSITYRGCTGESIALKGGFNDSIKKSGRFPASIQEKKLVDDVIYFSKDFSLLEDRKYSMKTLCDAIFTASELPIRKVRTDMDLKNEIYFSLREKGVVGIDNWTLKRNDKTGNFYYYKKESVDLYVDRGSKMYGSVIGKKDLTQCENSISFQEVNTKFSWLNVSE